MFERIATSRAYRWFATSYVVSANNMKVVRRGGIVAVTGGFTLIELLVVIAIIGILASIVLTSLNGARGKSRDAQRVANLQQMARALALVDPDSIALSGSGCTTSGDASTCNGPSPVNFIHYKDPTDSVNVCARTGDTSGGGASTPCQYLIIGGAAGNVLRPNNYQICTWLENGLGTGAGTAGMYNVSTTTGGTVRAGC